MEFNFWCASGAELSILANAIAIYISQMYDANDLITISNFVEALGEMLSLLAGQKARCENSKTSTNPINSLDFNTPTNKNKLT